MKLLRAICAGDARAVGGLLAESPGLAAERATGDEYLGDISHYLYAGDGALHVAAAGYGHAIARRLIAAGADVRLRNRRGAEPLHYAADGVPGSATWNPRAQAATIRVLISAGADANAADKSGVMPLHRAVRTRCAAAVRALIDGGADVAAANKSGSTAMELAVAGSGRGGSGSAAARAQQSEIIRLLAERGAR
jgi:hypothetical protein